MRKLANESIFRKITKPININIVINLLKANNAYNYSKCYTGQYYILSMLFLQFSSYDRLKDIHYKYKSSHKLAKKFNLLSFSQLSRLNKKRFNYIKSFFIHIL